MHICKHWFKDAIQFTTISQHAQNQCIHKVVNSNVTTDENYWVGHITVSQYTLRVDLRFYYIQSSEIQENIVDI